ncbi:MAG TPA: methyltransferase [Candidatus Dormibacteraeota bacterium]|jgi:hypothetical protein
MVDLVRGLIHGRWRAAALDAALRLGLPELLDGEALGAAEIAGRVGADEDGTRRLLRLLAALGLLASSDGGERFRGTEALRLLRADHPRTQRRDALHTLSGATRAAWDGLERAVREGPRAAGGLDPDASLRAYRAGVAAHNAGALLAAHPFPDEGVVVMVGADSGPALEAVLRAHPGLRGAVADDPRGPIPAGADVYVLLHALHDRRDEEVPGILAGIAGVMPPGAALVLLAAERREVGTTLLPAYLDVHALVTTGGRERTAEEHRALLTAAGLRVTSAAHPETRPGICIVTATKNPPPAGEGAIS